jgi:hypothetical protein
MKILMPLFLILSVFDFVGTVAMILLTKTNIEGNPLASFAYDELGVVGMGLYKALWVGVFLWTVRFLEGHKRGVRYAKPLLLFACFVSLLTVTYTSLLLAILYST